MISSVTLIEADPAGNRTLLVKTPFAPEARGPVAAALLNCGRWEAEQVGFILPRPDGMDGEMVMMGGEFCGNASRAFGLLVAREQCRSAGGGARPLTPSFAATLDSAKSYQSDPFPRQFWLRVSGASRPVCATVNLAAQTADVSMPLPNDVWELFLEGVPCVEVAFEGITHLVAFCPEKNEKLLQAAQWRYDGEPEVEAYGVMFLDRDALTMTPVVAVKATDTLVWEGSCGSGSVAAAVALTRGLPDGRHQFLLRQPRGELVVTLQRRNGDAEQVSIGGPVSLGEWETIELEWEG